MVQITINKETVQITSYGKSMFGGWYANLRYIDRPVADSFEGVRERTLTELCNKLHISKTALKRDVARFDNI